MRPYDPGEPLVWIHVPKAGGTSVRKIAQGWFDPRETLFHYRDPQFLSGLKEAQENDCREKGVRLLYGHFNSARGIGISALGFQPKQYVTILREPLERQVSLYFFLKAQGIQVHGKTEENISSLEDFLLTNNRSVFNHFPTFVDELTFKQVVDMFMFVGITEYLDFSLQRIACLLNRDYMPGSVSRTNVTPRPAYDISRQARISFMEKNRLEYLVYWYALERFSRDCSMSLF